MRASLGLRDWNVTLAGMRFMLSLVAVGALAFCAAGAGIADTAASSADAMGGATSVSSSDNDAAARHAKRTACLKEAKAKKLVGAQRAAFIKDCVAKP